MSQPQRCDRSLGTLAVVEDRTAPWDHPLTREYQLTSTALRAVPHGLGALVSLAASMRANEAAKTLALVDNRSGAKLAAAEGSAANTESG